MWALNGNRKYEDKSYDKSRWAQEWDTYGDVSFEEWLDWDYEKAATEGETLEEW
jgi:hypothetical protein